jgi:hypothetical protein
MRHATGLKTILATTTTIATVAMALIAAAPSALASAPDDVIAVTDPVRTPSPSPTRPSHRVGPDYVRIRDFTYAGTGCPAGSVALSMSRDSSAFSLLLEEFAAEAGPGVSISESHKNCQLLFDLDYPTGWQFALFTVDFSGYLSLDPGVTATQSARYYFQGQSQTANLATTFGGPDSRDYYIRDTFGPTSMVWSPCGAQRALNLNIAVDVSGANRNASGLNTTKLDPLGNGSLPIGNVWKRCR